MLSRRGVLRSAIAPLVLAFSCLAPPAVGQTVRGIADLHNHQMNHLGFGGHVVHGDAFGPIETALPWCSANHGPGGGNQFWLDEAHLVGGYPEFDGWPASGLKTHQQVYVDWLKRAHEGGLSLMVMLTGHNDWLCKFSGLLSPTNLAGLDCDGMTAIYSEVEHAKEMDRQFDWYEIVYTPAEARRAITDGKLAVVLGVEYPYLFDCGTGNSVDSITKNLAYHLIDESARQRTVEASATMDSPDLDVIAAEAENAKAIVDQVLDGHEKTSCTADGVRRGLDRLHDAGIRHVFPLHNANNAFGGAAIYDTVFALASPELNVPTLVDCSAQGFEFNRGYCNERGLTELGQVFIDELMRKGMVIDIDHMSYRTKMDVLPLVERNDYPMVSSHTGFIDVSRGNRLHEGNMSADILERIRQLGGSIAPIVVQGDTETTVSWRGRVPHECSGTSESYAQAYLYAAEKMQGIPVPLGSDFNGLAGLPGPRFKRDRAVRLRAHSGNYVRAAHGGGAEVLADRSEADAHESFQIVDYNGGALETGDTVSFRTANGAHYLTADQVALGVIVATRTSAKEWERFVIEKPGGGVIYAGDTVTLKTGNGKYIAAEQGGALFGNRDAASDWERFVLEFGGDEPFSGCYTPDSPKPRVQYPFTSSLTGRSFDRQVIGERTYDINVDGLTNVGMVPDLIEELKVLGLSDADLEPLYSSAEGYIQSWERSETARGKAQAKAIRLPLGTGDSQIASGSWDELAGFCGKRRGRLATLAEICAGGAGKAPVFGKLDGDVWMAVGDHPNAWISVGTSNPERLCRLHEELGAPPAWGSDRGPEPVTGRPAALACVTELPQISIADTGGSFNHDQAEAYCAARGMRLAREQELCPQGAGHAPYGGRLPGDVWMPTGDDPNAWISVGTSYPERLCRRHEELGSSPPWGTKKGPEPATGQAVPVLCMP